MSNSNWRDRFKVMRRWLAMKMVNRPQGKPADTQQDTNNASKAQQQNCSREIKIGEKIVVAFTVVSALGSAFSGGAALYTAFQLKSSSDQTNSAISEIGGAESAAQAQASEMRSQLSRMDTANSYGSQTADAAQSAVAKADKANQISEDAAKREMRAYIEVSPTNMSNLPEDSRIPTNETIIPGQKLERWFIIYNSGKTPARDIVVYANLETPSNDANFRSFEAKKADNFLDSFGEIRSGGYVTANRHTSEFMNNTDLSNIWLGVETEILRVRVTYRDVFNEKHETLVCSYWNRQNQIGGFCRNGTSSN